MSLHVGLLEVLRSAVVAGGLPALALLAGEAHGVHRSKRERRREERAEERELCRLRDVLLGEVRHNRDRAEYLRPKFSNGEAFTRARLRVGAWERLGKRFLELCDDPDEAHAFIEFFEKVDGLGDAIDEARKETTPRTLVELGATDYGRYQEAMESLAIDILNVAERVEQKAGPTEV